MLLLEFRDLLSTHAFLLCQEVFWAAVLVGFRRIPDFLWRMNQRLRASEHYSANAVAVAYDARVTLNLWTLLARV
mgnify:CR=1 FL=1